MKSFKEFLKKNQSQKEYIVEEHIEEMATVYTDEVNKHVCQVNPDRNRQGLEYFKLYNNVNWSKATKVARIEFRKPNYVLHTNKDGKENWKLNNREKIALIKALKMDSEDYPGYSNYQAAIIHFNREKGLSANKTKENLINDLKYPKFLPIDLPMPDYMKL